MFDLATIEKLGEELPLSFATGQHLFREALWVGHTGLKRDHLDKCRKRISRSRADVVVRIAHTSKDGYHEENHVGKRLVIKSLYDV